VSGSPSRRAMTSVVRRRATGDGARTARCTISSAPRTAVNRVAVPANSPTASKSTIGRGSVRSVHGSAGPASSTPTQLAPRRRRAAATSCSAGAGVGRTSFTRAGRRPRCPTLPNSASARSARGARPPRPRPAVRRCTAGDPASRRAGRRWRVDRPGVQLGPQIRQVVIDRFLARHAVASGGPHGGWWLEERRR